MKKIHTRAKRKYRLSTNLNQYSFFHPKINRRKPKTFKTEDAAHKWAQSCGLKQGQYCLKKVKRNKKFQVAMRNG